MQSDTVLFKIYKLGDNKEHIFFNEFFIKLDEKIINISEQSQKPIFVALGAAHLVGEKSIVANLKKAGFRIQK